MKFWEAMKALEEGKKVRCCLWSESLFIDESMRFELWLLDNHEPFHDKEWELHEEPVHMISFQDVIKGMREGKRFKRERWTSDLAIFIIGMEIYPRSKFGIKTLQMEDFEAIDWIEVTDES